MLGILQQKEGIMLNDKDYLEIVKDILDNDDFKKLKNYIKDHENKGNNLNKALRNKIVINDKILFFFF